MGRYVFGLLPRPSNPPSTSEKELDRIHQAHPAHLRRLLESGELIAAGPLEEPSDLRGVLGLRSGSIDRARDRKRSNPSTVSGRLTLDVHSWYAPGGLATGATPSPRRGSPPD